MFRFECTDGDVGYIVPEQLSYMRVSAQKRNIVMVSKFECCARIDASVMKDFLDSHGQLFQRFETVSGAVYHINKKRLRRFSLWRKRGQGSGLKIQVGALGSRTRTLSDVFKNVDCLPPVHESKPPVACMEISMINKHGEKQWRVFNHYKYNWKQLREPLKDKVEREGLLELHFRPDGERFFLNPHFIEGFFMTEYSTVVWSWKGERDCEKKDFALLEKTLVSSCTSE